MNGELQFQAGRFLAVGGVLLLIVGLLLMAGARFSFPIPGKLPGDIAIRNKNFSFYFPIVSCAMISILFTLVLWVISIVTRK